VDVSWDTVYIQASHYKAEGHSVVICAKTAEPIEMPFGLWVRIGPRNHVLYGGLDPPWEGEILVDRGAYCKV